MSVYSLVIARECGGIRDAQSRIAKITKERKLSKKQINSFGCAWKIRDKVSQP
jgi:hypothetical protein